MLLTDKYKPEVISDLVLPNRILEVYKSENTPLLLYGPAGCGKTTSAMVLAKKGPYKKINCSLETSIEVIRTQLHDFCSRASLFDDGNKTVILDEFEGVSKEFFKALRGVMEEYTRVRWIATTNYLEQVPVENQSRFKLVSFNFSTDDINEMKRPFLNWCVNICKNEGIKYDNPSIGTLYKNNFPDFRKILLTLDQIKGSTKELNTATYFNNAYTELFDKLISNISNTDLYTLIHTTYGSEVSDVFKSLSRDFIKYLIQKNRLSIIGNVAIIVHKYSYESKFAIDTQNSLYACAIELRNILK